MTKAETNMLLRKIARGLLRRAIQNSLVDPKEFETKLNAEQETQFQQWLAGQKQSGNIHPLDTGVDYDFRGAWLNRETANPDNRHWSDRFKKPNHPTFSNQSKYSKGHWSVLAGKWNRDRFIEPF